MVLGASAVSVQYSADGSAYTQTMGEMVTATGQFADVADGVVGSVSKMGIGITKLTADTTAFGHSTNIAVRQAAAYQQALQGLEIRAEAAGKSFQKVGSIVRESARQSPVGLSKTLEQYEALFEMGVTSDNKLKPLADSLTRVQAATNNLGNQQFANNMLTLGRTFDAMDPVSIDNISDSIVTMTSKVGGSATAVAGFSNQIAPLSEQLGMSQTSVVGFANAFAKAGQDGGRAASVYTRMLSGMERSVREGTDGIKVYADAIGKSTEATKELVQSNPAEAMAQMFDALSGNSSKEAIRTLERIGLEGPRSLKTISAVMSAGGVRSSLDAARGGYADDSSIRASEKALGGLNNELKKTQESMSQMIEASGRPFVGMLSDIAKMSAKVSSIGAGVAGGGFAQGIGAAMVPLMAFGSVASKGFGAWSGTMLAKQGIKSLPGAVSGAFTGTGALAAGGPARSWMGANRGLMIGGGAAGVAGGMALDNPMVATLGMMAMMGGAPGKFGQVAGKISSAAQDAFIWDRFDMAGKTLGPNAAASRAGIAAPFGVSGGAAFRKGSGQVLQQLTGLSSKEISNMFLTKGGGLDTVRLTKAIEEARIIDELSHAESVKKGLSAAEAQTAATKENTSHIRTSNDIYKKANPQINQGTAAAARGVKGLPGAVKSSVMAGGSAALSSVAAHPYIAGTLAAGAVAGVGYWGYKQNQEQLEEARDPANSQTRLLAERYGLSLNEFDRVNDEVKSRTKRISGWSDAYDIDTTLAARMQGSEDYGWELTDWQKKDANATELAYEIIRTGGAQGPQYVGSMFQDLAAQVGPLKAQQVADQVQLMGVGSAASIGLAGTHITDSASTEWGERGWYGNTAGLIKNDYEGMTEQVDQGTSTGIQKSTVISQKTAIGGPQAGAKQKLEYIDQLKKQVTSGSEMNLEAVRADLGRWLTPTEVDTTMSEIERFTGQSGFLPKAVESILMPGNEVKNVLQRRMNPHPDLKSGIGDVVDLANKPVDLTELRKLGKSKDFVSVQYEKFARAAHGLNLTTDQLLDLREKGSDSEYAQTDSVVTAFDAWKGGDEDKGSMEDFLRKGMGVTDDAVAVSRAHSTPGSPAAMMGARRASLASGQTSEQVIKGVTNSLVTEPSKALTEVQLAVFNQAMQSQTQTEMASLSPGGALEYKVARGKMLQKEGEEILAVNKNDELATQMVQQGEAMELEGALGEQSRYKNYLTQMFNFQKQSGRAWEDYYRVAGEARQDFERSEFRATEDHYRQVRYMTSDHHRQQRYAQENFDLQLKRQAEDAAGSMMNPFQREQAKPVWSAGGLSQNIREQNQDLNRQSRVLRGLSKRGLSDEVIRMLKLSDPGNAQQVFQLEGMSNREVRELNRQAGKRGSIAGKFINSEFNTGTERAKENLSIQFERGDEAFDISLKRGDEALSRSLGRAGDDLERNLERQRKNVSRSLERTKTDINDSLKGIKGDFRDTMNAISDISETGTTDFSRIMGGGLDEISGQFDESGNKWGRSTSKKIKAIDKILRKFASKGEAVPYLDPGSTSGNAVGSSAMISSRFAGVGGGSPGGSFDTGTGIGGGGGVVSRAGSGEDSWKVEFNAKQEKLLEGIEKFGPLNSGAMGSFKGEVSDFDKSSAFGEANMTDSGRAIGRAAAALFPGLSSIGGWRPYDPYPDHPSGNAVDIMIPNWDSKSGKALGDEIADFYTSNADAFGVQSMIWQQRYWNRNSGWSGSLMGDRGSPTQNHMDHLHILGGGSLGSIDTTGLSAEDIESMSIWEMGDKIWKRGRADKRDARLNSGGSSGVPGADKSVKGDWTWPFRGGTRAPSTVGSFGYDRGTHLHSGIDTGPLGGDPRLYSIGAGVATVGWDGAGYGNYAIIAHPGGYKSLYGHMDSVAVRGGQHVDVGQSIGVMGSTGRSTGSHLHLNVSKPGADIYGYAGNVDPWAFLNANAGKNMAEGGVVTKPINVNIGEAGDQEAVIPLNRGGVETIAEAIAKYSSQYEAKVSRTAPYSKPVTNNTYITDKSTRFTGDIAVSAESPDDLVAALVDKQRSDNLFDVRS